MNRTDPPDLSASSAGSGRGRDGLPDELLDVLQAEEEQERMYPSGRSLDIIHPSWRTECHVSVKGMLDCHFHEVLDVFVALNLNLYYEEGRPESMVCPDVFVVHGAREEQYRRVWMTWEEDGQVPDFAFEVISDPAWRRDREEKQEIYARLGVREYFQYDPRELYRQPALEGLRLEGSRYRVLSAEVGPDGSRRVHSETLSLTLCDIRAEERLRMFDPATGEYLPTYVESLREVEALQREGKTREAEAALRREIIARQKEERKRQEAIAARQEAEAARQEEVAARQEAEAKVAELEARLRTLEERGAPDG